MSPELIICASIVLSAAVVLDLYTQKIPNLLTYPVMAAAMSYHFYVEGPQGGLLSVLGLALGIAFFTLPYVMGGMGGGDVKLVGVVGALFGAKAVFVASIFSVVVGGLYALTLLLAHQRFACASRTTRSKDAGPAACTGSEQSMAEQEKPKYGLGVQGSSPA